MADYTREELQQMLMEKDEDQYMGLKIDIPSINTELLDNIKLKGADADKVKGVPEFDSIDQATNYILNAPSGEVVGFDENGKPVIKIQEDGEFESMLSLVGVDSLDDLGEWVKNNGLDVAALGLMFVPGVGWLSAGFRGQKAIAGLKALVEKTGKGSWKQFRKLWTKNLFTKSFF